MKSFNPRSERLQKWGLFVLLAGSIGFSLSMNPEHFNNIARNENKVYSIELAQTKSEGGTTSGTTAAPAAPAPGEGSATKYELTRIVDNKICKISVGVLGNETIARFKSAPQATESQACHAEALRPLTSNISDLKNIETEIDLYLASLGKKTASKGDKKDNDDEEKKEVKRLKVSGKEYEVTKAKLSEIAKICKKKEERLDCHRENLMKLSKLFEGDDSSEAREIMKKYFAAYVAPQLSANFNAPTIDPVTMRVNTTRLEEANEIALDLMENLDGDNSADVLKALTAMKAKSTFAQINHSRNMYIQSQIKLNSTDLPTKFHGQVLEQRALELLHPQRLNAVAAYERDLMATALSVNNSSLEDIVNPLYYTPIQEVSTQLQNIDFINAINNRSTVLTQINGLSFPEISGSLATIPSPSLDYTTGLPSNFVALAGRIGRGTSLTPIYTGSSVLPAAQKSLLETLLLNGRTSRGQ